MHTHVDYDGCMTVAQLIKKLKEVKNQDMKVVTFCSYGLARPIKDEGVGVHYVKPGQTDEDYPDYGLVSVGNQEELPTDVVFRIGEW